MSATLSLKTMKGGGMEMMESMKRCTRLVHSVIGRRDKSGSQNAFKLPPFERGKVFN